MRALVLEHGRASCCYQALDDGLEHWLAADGTAAVAYRCAGSTWIAVGGPIAAPLRAAAAAREFAAAATAADRRLLWFLAEPHFVTAAGEGLRWLRIGAQPIWTPVQLCSEIERHRSLRLQLQRAANKGVAVVEWRNGAVSSLHGCLTAWLRRRRAPPLQFLAGPTRCAPHPIATHRDALDLRDRRVFVATRSGQPVAYLLLAPIPARGGFLVEQLVRGDDSCNGTAELLLHSAARTLADDGAAMLTLGLAPLSRRCAMPAETGHLAMLLRAARAVCRPFYDFDGVDAWKAKFRPGAWEPLYLGCEAPHLRLRDLAALLHAETGGRILRFAAAALTR